MIITISLSKSDLERIHNVLGMFPKLLEEMRKEIMKKK